MKETAARKVEDIVVGMYVDLESCPVLKNHSSADSQYALVEHFERETDGCICLGYEGIDHVGYPVGTELQVRIPLNVPDKVIKVRPAGIEGAPEWSEWNISCNLTDRWGEINFHDEENKPLEALLFETGLLTRLREQMWDEICFVVRKDGQFGILFEVEFCSEESEGKKDPDWEYRPHAQVVSALLDGLGKLAAKYPGVSFAVPHENQVIDDRPAAWAYVPDGLLDEAQREALGIAMLEL